MKHAIILAGGTGTRMGNTGKPKQYLDLGGKPIIAHTVAKFLAMPDFESVVVPCPVAWVESTRDILKRSFGENPRLMVIAGGTDRNGSLMAALKWIRNTFGIDGETIVCTHDAVRPFVTYRIIKENLAAAKKTGACDTVIPASDTIVISDDGESVASIPPRNRMYQGQTPQTFRADVLLEVLEGLSIDESASLTDACGAFLLQGREVALVEGDPANMKVTWPSDLKMARALLGEVE